jgi:hypothetical protein
VPLLSFFSQKHLINITIVFVPNTQKIIFSDSGTKKERNKEISVGSCRTGRDRLPRHPAFLWNLKAFLFPDTRMFARSLLAQSRMMHCINLILFYLPFFLSQKKEAKKTRQHRQPSPLCRIFVKSNQNVSKASD